MRQLKINGRLVEIGDSVAMDEDDGSLAYALADTVEAELDRDTDIKPGDAVQVHGFDFVVRAIEGSHIVMDKVREERP